MAKRPKKNRGVLGAAVTPRLFVMVSTAVLALAVGMVAVSAMAAAVFNG